MKFAVYGVVEDSEEHPVYSFGDYIEIKGTAYGKSEYFDILRRPLERLYGKAAHAMSQQLKHHWMEAQVPITGMLVLTYSCFEKSRTVSRRYTISTQHSSTLNSIFENVDGVALFSTLFNEHPGDD